MPIYEYEPVDWDCMICKGRFEALQRVDEDSLTVCPTCGMDCRRVVSQIQVRTRKHHGADHAGRKGFTTYKKSQKGVWEKVGGEGVDAIVGQPEDVAAIEAEKKPKKKIDLDNMS